ncbi:unnamed protein product [Nippostrongylus brasiliensis]|uniref:Secreted protein n=1 Tax=Nippostrongylus brasiliensis TaxID=27835 RepID=A0A0N4Y0T6_NIPBR|nr:unnamed protein product [Nippostrongylus brasiliensis]
MLECLRIDAFKVSIILVSLVNLRSSATDGAHTVPFLSAFRVDSSHRASLTERRAEFYCPSFHPGASFVETWPLIHLDEVGAEV